MKNSHWILRVLGALPICSLVLMTVITAMKNSETTMSEPILLLAITFVASSVAAGIALFRVAGHLESHNL